MTRLPGPELLNAAAQALHGQWQQPQSFKHAVLDHFLPDASARWLEQRFPQPDHRVWLDWRTRSPHQYGKQGVGDAARFHLLDADFREALEDFNSPAFIAFLETVTGIPDLLPDPHFTGGGLHQILTGGILDIHTDFNYYERLGTYQRLNVILYLTREWEAEFGGCLELWDAAPNRGGHCFREIAPLLNRLVIFETNKLSFHGHPQAWAAPLGNTRKSIALYYYTTDPEPGMIYDTKTDFQGVVANRMPLTARAGAMLRRIWRK